MPFGSDRTALFAAAAVAYAGVTAYLNVAGPDWFIPLVLTVALIAGLPHGAFDLYLLRKLAPRRLWLWLFAYAAAACAVALCWWLLPAFSLAAFVVYSAWHFGESDWSEEPRAVQAAWGTLLLAVPAITQPGEVTALFSVLSNETAAEHLNPLLQVTAAPAVIVLVTRARQIEVQGALLIGYGVLCVVSSALAAFAGYFALLHAPRHLRFWRSRVTTASLAGAYALAGAAFAVFCGAVAAAGSEDLATASARSAFILLAALTVPHMIVVSLAHRHAALASPSAP